MAFFPPKYWIQSDLKYKFLNKKKYIKVSETKYQQKTITIIYGMYIYIAVIEILATTVAQQID